MMVLVIAVVSQRLGTLLGVQHAPLAAAGRLTGLWHKDLSIGYNYRI